MFIPLLSKPTTHTSAPRSLLKDWLLVKPMRFLTPRYFHVPTVVTTFCFVPFFVQATPRPRRSLTLFKADGVVNVMGCAVNLSTLTLPLKDPQRRWDTCFSRNLMYSFCPPGYPRALFFSPTLIVPRYYFVQRALGLFHTFL